MNAFLVGLTVATIACAGAARAQEAPFAMEIKARQGLMNINALSMSILGGMAKGEVPYDSAKAQEAADNIVKVVGLDVSMLWPAGSDQTANPASHALPAAWAADSDVGAKFEAWQKAALAMQTAAGKDLASLQAAMEPLGAACGGCHKTNRAPQE